MNRYRACACSAIALVVWSTDRANAAPMTTTASKIIIWSFGAAPAATDMNTYTWDLTAKASTPTFAADTKTNASPAKPPTWAGNAALPATPQTSGQATSGAATAEAMVTFSANAPIAVGGGGFQSTTNISFSNVIDNGGNNKASASATGMASISLKGGNAERAIITQPNGVVSTPKLKGGTVNFGPNAKGVWQDPISVSVTDTTTNTFVGSSLLGSDDGSYTGAGTFEWDSSGITLTAPNDGFSSAELDFSIGGPWVSNSSAGMVTLQNGVFTATGVFATLPWMLDSLTDPQQATLSPSSVPSLEMDYQVPSSIMNDTDNYQPELDFNGTLSDSVPEPGSIGLIGVALVALSRRANRRAR